MIIFAESFLYIRNVGKRLFLHGESEFFFKSLYRFVMNMKPVIVLCLFVAIALVSCKKELNESMYPMEQRSTLQEYKPTFDDLISFMLEEGYEESTDESTDSEIMSNISPGFKKWMVLKKWMTIVWLCCMKIRVLILELRVNVTRFTPLFMMKMIKQKS